MGIFDKIFGPNLDYPELAENNRASALIKSQQQNLQKLVNEIPDSLEVLPSEKAIYAFIGKPPKKFGVAWIEEDGKINNFKTLIDEKGLMTPQLTSLSDKLRAVYIKHQQESRYLTTIGERKIVVTPSPPLLEEIKSVISDIVG